MRPHSSETGRFETALLPRPIALLQNVVARTELRPVLRCSKLAGTGHWLPLLRSVPEKKGVRSFNLTFYRFVPGFVEIDFVENSASLNRLVRIGFKCI